MRFDKRQSSDHDDGTSGTISIKFNFDFLGPDFVPALYLNTEISVLDLDSF